MKNEYERETNANWKLNKKVPFTLRNKLNIFLFYFQQSSNELKIKNELNEVSTVKEKI